MKEFSINSIVLIILFTWGCAGAPSAPERRTAPSTEDYCARAIENEKNGELQLALFNLDSARRLDPHNDEISKKIEEVQAKIQRRSEKHFKKGLHYLQRESPNQARREFLIALRYNPDHKGALNYLKNVLPGKEYTEYKVEREETLKDIARAVYNDSKMDFLIAYFNDLDLSAYPSAGNILKLPILGPDLMSQFTDVAEEFQRAQMLFNNKKYEEAISVADKILEYDPTNEQAARLVDASNYEIGKRLRRQGKYSKSLEALNKVTPEYKDVQKVIANVKRTLEKQAEEHYRKGVKFFVNEELERAIKEWEKTLALNPDHKKAKANIEKTRTLLETLKTVK